MKDRILAYLDEFANGKEGDLATELKEELKLDALSFQAYAQEARAAILHDYSQFAISTIDAFFQKVIRSFTREAGLNGDYRLEIDQDLVLEEVIDNLIDELGTNSELTEWVVEYARENLENDKPWDVRRNLLEFSREIFREEFKVIEDDVATATKAENYFQNLRHNLMKVRMTFLRRLNKDAGDMLEIIRTQPWSIDDLNHGHNSGLPTLLNSLTTARRVGGLPKPGVRALGMAASASVWPKKTSPHRQTILQIAESELAPRLQALIDLLESGITDALSAEVALENLYVFGLIADISRKLREYKHEHNLMLLADAPKFLNRIIEDSETPFVYEKVGSFYRNYLIDEFQDTSGLQWKNFLPLLRNSLDQGYPSLVVGDVKQAIYRWRGGDLNLLHSAVEQDVGNARVDKKSLNANYRSAANVVNFNNAFFTSASAIASVETGHPLASSAYEDVAQLVTKKEDGFVRVHFLQDQPDGENWKEQALKRIPGYLEQLQSVGVPLNQIAILVRRNDEGQEIIRHLLEYRISGSAKPGCKYDIVSGESLRIDSAATISLLEGALKYLLNPEDALARAQLAFEYARITDPDRPLTEVFAVTNAVVFESVLPSEFTRQKALLKKLPLFELTESLIGIFKLGQQKGELAYLQAFQNLVLDFFNRDRNDLGAFLEWWELNKQKKSIPVSGQVDAVQIISIHKSKGLQFRYVLLPFCSWMLDHDSFKAPQLWVKSDHELFRNAGYLPVKYNSTLDRTHFRTFYEEERIRTYLDNLNLLYVALTRAESGLTLFAPHPANKGGKKTVAGLLYSAIENSLQLLEKLNKNEGTLSIGEIAHSRTEKTETPNTVPLQTYSVSSWREKLVIRKSAPGFFESDDDRREKINYGIHLHAVLSRIRHEGEIESVLADLEMSGSVTSSARTDLAHRLNTLMENEKVRSWFSGDWDVRTEVPILLPGGTESRVDRLLISGRKAVVIDFKTGEPTKADQKQVADYLETVRRMNFIEPEGYLLYVKTGEIIAVAPSRSRVTKKKDDNQLDLGL